VKKNVRKEGFTLIEVIAVLLVVAILAAVAIPKFMSLANDAQQKALEGALAAGLSQCSLAYGKLCLANHQEPSATQVATEAGNNPPGGDYTYAFAASGSNVLVTATAPNGTDNKTKTWYMP